MTDNIHVSSLLVLDPATRPRMSILRERPTLLLAPEMTVEFGTNLSPLQTASWLRELAEQAESLAVCVERRALDGAPC